MKEKDEKAIQDLFSFANAIYHIWVIPAVLLIPAAFYIYFTEGKNIITNDISSANDALDYASFCSTVVTFALSDCFLYVPYSTNTKWEYYKELSERNDGSFLDQIDSLDVELDNLTNDLRLILTQQDALSYLEELINNQKSNKVLNTQSRMAAVFKTLKHA